MKYEASTGLYPTRVIVYVREGERERGEWGVGRCSLLPFSLVLLIPFSRLVREIDMFGGAGMRPFVRLASLVFSQTLFFSLLPNSFQTLFP